MRLGIQFFGLDVTPVPTSPGKSHRTIATTRVQSEACGDVMPALNHWPLVWNAMMESPFTCGMSLVTNFDRKSCSATLPVAYQTSAEMMNLLANSHRVKECLTRKVSQFAGTSTRYERRGRAGSMQIRRNQVVPTRVWSWRSFSVISFVPAQPNLNHEFFHSLWFHGDTCRYNA